MQHLFDNRDVTLTHTLEKGFCYGTITCLSVLRSLSKEGSIHALLLWELQYVDLRVLTNIFNLRICYGYNRASVLTCECLHMSVLCASVEQET